MRALILTHWFLMLGAGLASQIAAAWPAVPLLEDTQGEMVSSHMNVNGIDMRASQFVTPQPFDTVLQFYREYWEQTVVNEVDGVVIVGTAVDESYYITVSLTPAGGHTQGQIGIVRIPDEREPPFQPGAGFDRPAGTQVTSDIRHLDLPNQARTLAMENELSPFANRQYFLERLHTSGWRIVEAPDCLANAMACMLRMEQRRGDRLTMTMLRAGDFKTQITVLIES